MPAFSILAGQQHGASGKGGTENTMKRKCNTGKRASGFGCSTRSIIRLAHTCKQMVEAVFKLCFDWPNGQRLFATETSTNMGVW